MARKERWSNPNAFMLLAPPPNLAFVQIMLSATQVTVNSTTTNNSQRSRSVSRSRPLALVSCCSAVSVSVTSLAVLQGDEKDYWRLAQIIMNEQQLKHTNLKHLVDQILRNNNNNKQCIFPVHTFCVFVQSKMSDWLYRLTSYILDKTLYP